MNKKKILSLLMGLAMTASLSVPVYADTVSGDTDTLNNNVNNAINLTVNSGDAWSIGNCGVTVLRLGSTHVVMADGVSGIISTDSGLTLSKSNWSINAYGQYDNFSVSGTAPVNSGTSTVTYAYKVQLTCNSSDDIAGLGNKPSDFININITVKPATVTLADTTAPSVTANTDRDANANGWYNNDVTVSFSATDPEATITSVDGPKTVTTEGKDQVISGSATNSAGLTGTGSTTISIDKTAPTITGTAGQAANAAGWYNHDVTVSFDANDALSGVANSSAPTTLGEGKDQSVTGTATDKAGNNASATVSGINIDETAPTITVQNGGTYLLNQNVTWSASDALSGLATQGSGTIDTSKVGLRTQTITAADNAGNTNTVTITYNVKYAFSGILDPINANGSSLFKAGSTIPVKFTLKDSSGAYVSTANATVTYSKLSDNVYGTDVEAISTSAATTGNAFRYDSISNQYIFNMSTKGLTAGTYRLTIKLDDGMSYPVQISLK
ncbi:MAG: PxKF domain-containing protein [Bacillota bacterium]|nr:PxKF domain-containing protein [Bacillota bacterium]